MIVILMGAAGAGKTTIGERLAAALGWPFYDADALHPPENLALMRSGSPLDDEARTPWLEAVAALIASMAEMERSAVIACSALREEYRRRLRRSGGTAPLRFVYLRASREVLAARLAIRAEHFFPSSLLASQLAALEEPASPAIIVDADGSIAEVVERVQEELERSRG